MRNPIRVLIVTNMYPSAAGQTDGIFIKRQVDALKSNFDDIEIRVCHIDTIRSKARYLTGWWHVLRELVAFKPSLVHVHYGLSLAFFPPPLPLIYPTVITLHGSDITIGWQRRFTRLLATKRSYLIFVAKALHGLLNFETKAGYRVIPCGVNASIFSEASPAVAIGKIELKKDEKLILFGANPNRPVKDYALFQSAAALLIDRSPAYRFATLADFDPTDVPSAIVAAKVLVLTSLREGSPVVTKEALCAGTRVVAVNVGDVAEQLEPFTGTILVQSRTAKAVADGVEAALMSPAPDKQMASEVFDVQREASAISEIYRELIGD